MYHSPLPVPCALGGLGAIAGLLGGGLNQCFPVWVGAATGGSIGCVLCIGALIKEEAQPVRRISIGGSSGSSRSSGSSEPVIIQNIYITYEITGRGKDDVIPIAKVIQEN
jgi:hypothetical protein